MPIFKDTSGALKKLNTLPLDKEKNLQKLVEDNLMEVLELHFLATEYVTTFGGRIDTLAVDINGAPVIIEYKRNKNDNVINQALSYLKWLRAQKPEFFQMLMINKLGQGVAESIKLDWNNPRVICIAESYSKFDVDTVEVVPLRIELFKYRYYEQGIFGLESLTVPEAVSATTPVSTGVTAEKPTSSVALLREKGSQAIRELFDQMQEQIVNLDEASRKNPPAFMWPIGQRRTLPRCISARTRSRFTCAPSTMTIPGSWWTRSRTATTGRWTGGCTSIRPKTWITSWD